MFELVRAGLGHRQPWRNLGTCQPRRTTHFRERHQAVIMHMVAEHRRRQEEDLMQMVFRLNAAVQHQGMREGSAKQPCGYTPVQVSAAFLDTRNLPCNFLPPIQEPEGWNVLRNMLIDLINEDRVSVVGVATGAG